MRGADDGLFGAYLLDPSQQKLAGAAGLLDLSEHRLGQLLAQPIAARITAGLDLFTHGLDT